jgi:hypothetical protein
MKRNMKIITWNLNFWCNWQNQDRAEWQKNVQDYLNNLDVDFMLFNCTQGNDFRNTMVTGTRLYPNDKVFVNYDGENLARSAQIY